MLRMVTRLKTTDGIAELFVRRFAPSSRPAPRTLVIVHGAGEHGGRYSHFVSHAIAQGWAVIVGDLRGHGRSGGIPTHIDHFDQYLADLDLLWQHFELRAASTAVFAHSMGGLAAVRYAQTRPEAMSALVLSAPLLALKVRVRLLKRAVGRVCSVVAPRTRFRTTVQAHQITRSVEALARRADDPLMRRSVTARWFFRVQSAVVTAHRDAARLGVPVMLLQGEADEVVDPLAAESWMAGIGSTDRTIRMLPDHLHELIHEPEWESTAADILQWLDERLPMSQPELQTLRCLEFGVSRAAQAA